MRQTVPPRWACRLSRNVGLNRRPKFNIGDIVCPRRSGCFRDSGPIYGVVMAVYGFAESGSICYSVAWDHRAEVDTHLGLKPSFEATDKTLILALAREEVQAPCKKKAKKRRLTA